MQCTVVPYMYRDRDNYKAHHEIVLEGTITEEQKQAVDNSLSGGELFCPKRVNWPHAANQDAHWTWGLDPDEDHWWHELDIDDIYSADLDKSDGQSVDEWVAAMVREGHNGWEAPLLTLGGD